MQRLSSLLLALLTLALKGLPVACAARRNAKHRLSKHDGVSAQSFLRSARKGVCAVTNRDTPRSNWNCEHGQQGTFSSLGYLPSWSAMAGACLRRCAACKGCSFISLSVDYQECAWFSSCNTSALITIEPPAAGDFVTGRLSEAGRSTLLEAAGGGGSTPPPAEGGQGGKLPRGALGLSWREWTSRGTRWLTHAAGGHCGKTTGESDCTDGESGVLQLPSDSFKDWRGKPSWARAATDCLEMCAECASCRFVSVSTKSRDCSWYARCDLGALHGAHPKDGKMPRHRSGLATAHRAVGLGSEATAHAALAARTPLRPLIAVTISYPHGEQLHKLEHCLRRLEGVGALHWIVVEDAAAKTPAVTALLQRVARARTGVQVTHLAEGPSHAKGHVQRNLAYAHIREQKLEGVVYNMDDDNEYDPRLWPALRRLGPMRVGVVAVLLDGETGNVERSLWARRPPWRFKEFRSGWCYNSHLSLLNGNRRFCIDMGGFAFDAALIHQRDGPLWDFGGRHNLIDRNASHIAKTAGGYTASGGATWRGGESEFLETLVSFPEDLEPLANCGADVLVYHNGWQSDEQSIQRPWKGRVLPPRMCKSDGW